MDVASTPEQEAGVADFCPTGTGPYSANPLAKCLYDSDVRLSTSPVGEWSAPVGSFLRGQNARRNGFTYDPSVDLVDPSSTTAYWERPDLPVLAGH